MYNNEHLELGCLVCLLADAFFSFSALVKSSFNKVIVGMGDESRIENCIERKNLDCNEDVDEVSRIHGIIIF
jgi:hypothetical protein